MNDDERLAARICPNCSVALMYPHPEEKFEHLYLKCPVCGFTKCLIKKSN